MKMIQSLKFALLGVGLACVTPSLLAQEERTQISGYLMLAEGTPKYLPVVLIGTNSRGLLFYKENPKAANIIRARIDKYPGIWLFEPKDVTAAKDLYESRKYKEALTAFKKLQVTYRDFKYLNDSYFETAEYYEMECYRKLKDYNSLSKRLETYRPDRLTRPGVVAQTKIYRLYDAIHKKDWSRLETLCDDYIKDPELTLSQRAQISYGFGLAYDGQKRYDDALNAFATAMNKEVQVAMRLWKTEDEETNSAGYRKLAEANALARLYDTAGLGFGVALPADYKKFQTFTTDQMAQRIKDREASKLQEDIDTVEEKGVKPKGE